LMGKSRKKPSQQKPEPDDHARIQESSLPASISLA
jgi:hypothetical protein